MLTRPGQVWLVFISSSYQMSLQNSFLRSVRTRGSRHPEAAIQRSDAGLTLLEVTIAFVILTLSTLTALGLMVGSMCLDATNRETAQAMAAARGVVEGMQGQEFSQIFALYNGNPNDDPVGVAAPGCAFAVGGLAPQQQVAGTIRFPATPNSELREDVYIPELGLPMDLNGDGIIDGLDHSQDYKILPVIVEIQWVGKVGDRELSLHALLMETGS